MKKLTVLLLALLFANVHAEEARWWKGNTHAHSWWSDGDAPPELVADWYRRNDYNFLVLSDHNIMKVGEKWYPVDTPPRRPEQVKDAFVRYMMQFGDAWVETRGEIGGREVKLKTLEEYRNLFETPDEFIFINGEEITDRFERHPIHMNGVNLVEHIDPVGGTSIQAVMQNNLNAVRRQESAFSQPMVVHINHPNFHYAISAEHFFDLEHEPGEGFFEMYNGHSGVDNYGDELHLATERMWDVVLSQRLGPYNRSVIYGVATDDSHEYSEWGTGRTNPGRGWIMVRSPFLTPNEITKAIKSGDFYSSTGVEFSKLELGTDLIEVAVKEKPGVEYRIEFIGTKRDADFSYKMKRQNHAHRGNENHHHSEQRFYSESLGRILASSDGPHASYTPKGDELYVRVRVTSTRSHPNPYADGDYEMAWSQPVVIGK